MELCSGGENHSGSSANVANRGGRGGGRGRNNNHGGRGGFGRGNGGRGNGNTTTNQNQSRQGGRGNSNPPRCSGNTGSASRPQCQVCLETGHTAYRCWHRFEEDYVPEERHAANSATNSYTYDTNWYTDTGATDHITGELEKLAVRDRYNGSEQIHTANGAGMQISHIGHSTIHTLSRSLNLKNILHVPSSKKNLLSVHRLASNNNVFLEFHPDVKTGRVYISRDVVFDENVFPFTKLHPNAASRLATKILLLPKHLSNPTGGELVDDHVANTNNQEDVQIL
jgi:histone deacetylase 1/2